LIEQDHDLVLFDTGIGTCINEEMRPLNSPLTGHFSQTGEVETLQTAQEIQVMGGNKSLGISKIFVKVFTN
jgi:hypothetical protein